MSKKPVYRMPDTNEEWLEVAHLLETLAGYIRDADASEPVPHDLYALADAMTMHERNLMASALLEVMPEIERRARENY